MNDTAPAPSGPGTGPGTSTGTGTASGTDGGAGSSGGTVWRSAAGRRVVDPTGDRKEREVRSMLDLVHPPAPPDLAERAMVRGRRLLRLRRVRDVVLWLLLVAVLVAAGVVAASYARPDAPLRVTPPISGS